MKKFTKKELVRFEHCDPAGIVFYPRYFVMVNNLVEDFFAEKLQYPFDEMHKDSGVPTVNMKTDFKMPARIGDTITKNLWVTKIGNSSVTYAYHFEIDEKTVLQGEGTLVYVSIENHQISSKNWTEHLKNSLEKFLISD